MWKKYLVEAEKEGLKSFKLTNFFRKFSDLVAAQVEKLQVLQKSDSGRNVCDLVASEVQAGQFWNQ